MYKRWKETNKGAILFIHSLFNFHNLYNNDHTVWNIKWIEPIIQFLFFNLCELRV